MVELTHKMILSSGRFSGTKRQDLAAAFQAFAGSHTDRSLVIHFHGGLVSQADAEIIAQRLLPVYSQAGAYPLFVMWQSGLLETLENNWEEIAREDILPSLAEPVLRFILGKLDQEAGQRGGTLEILPRIHIGNEISGKRDSAGEPFAERCAETIHLDAELTAAEEEQFKQLLSQDAGFARATAKISSGDGPKLSPEIGAEFEKAGAARGFESRGLVSTATLIAAGVRILRRALERFASGRDHGIYVTVIEEVTRELKGDLFGGIVWKHMKKDTADSFEGPPDQCGGSALLEELAKLGQASGVPRIVLVGHSAGSVYICNFLRKAVAIVPENLRFEVVFLAPACSFKLLDNALLAAKDRISAFRSFGMRDAVEIQDAVLAPLYPRSLLYLVSGLAEESVDLPIVGMERYHGKMAPYDASAFPEIKRVLDHVSAFESPWIWSESTAGVGRNSLAHKHGDFDNDSKTLESVAHLVTKGWTR